MNNNKHALSVIFLSSKARRKEINESPVGPKISNKPLSNKLKVKCYKQISIKVYLKVHYK